MSRLLHAAARGARIEKPYKETWVETQFVLTSRALVCSRKSLIAQAQPIRHSFVSWWQTVQHQRTPALYVLHQSRQVCNPQAG